MDIDIQKLNEIDLKNIGTLPFAIRVAIIVVLCCVTLGLGYVLDVQSQLTTLSVAEQKELDLKTKFSEQQTKAANLDAYKQQMKDMEESFGTMLRQLPSKNEVADLLVDVTQAGLASGLTFSLFKPEKETPLEFYAELPITLEVTGSYHDFGSFVSGIAALPRIVTLHNINISGKGDRTPLVMKATARTYRYLDSEEIAAAAAERAKSKKKGK